ncbi:hypothetical protein [Noviherbaspirillum soli]|uniref:hypothetical protein n=1 Tax=Noviherbaspirillum soli TaxID=1064518 RepID=UPI00188C12AB|nr:hypothetical protein [Noviherbaspirillum soli]
MTLTVEVHGIFVRLSGRTSKPLQRTVTESKKSHFRFKALRLVELWQQWCTVGSNGMQKDVLTWDENATIFGRNLWLFSLRVEA